MYNLGSDVLHGKRARGVDLREQGGADPGIPMLRCALLALDRVTWPEATLEDIGSPVSRVLLGIAALSRAVSRPDVNFYLAVRDTLRTSGNMKPGRDYTGSGTLEDPYVFATGRDYFEDFYSLCDQLELDAGNRYINSDSVGRFVDCVSGPDRLYVFLADLTPMAM